jgi:hypothetical protein
MWFIASCSPSGPLLRPHAGRGQRGRMRGVVSRRGGATAGGALSGHFLSARLSKAAIAWSVWALSSLAQVSAPTMVEEGSGAIAAPRLFPAGGRSVKARPSPQARSA